MSELSPIRSQNPGSLPLVPRIEGIGSAPMCVKRSEEVFTCAVNGGAPAMISTKNFIVTLRTIADEDTSLDRPKEAVQEIVQRYLRDVYELPRRDQEKARARITDLRLELTRQTVQIRADRFGEFRECVCSLLADWLRENLER